MRNNTNILLIFIILLLGGGVYYYHTRMMDLMTRVTIEKQNAGALNDSLRVSKNKFGELTFSKMVLVGDNKMLEATNKELFKELSKTQGKVSELTKMNFTLRQKRDTVVIHENLLTQESDSIYNIEWEQKDNYGNGNTRHLLGKTRFILHLGGESMKLKPLNTLLLKDELTFNVTQGLREKDGKVEVFVTTTYPGLEATELNSIILNPETHPVITKFRKKKRIRFGFYTGYGLTYDADSNKIYNGFQGGLGAMFTF